MPDQGPPFDPGPHPEDCVQNLLMSGAKMVTPLVIVGIAENRIVL